MRPLARSSLPFFDSATPSPSLPSSSAAPTPPRTPLTLAPPAAHVDSATVVVPAVEGRPVSLSASVLLHGGSGDSARPVGARSRETGEVLPAAGQCDESSGAPHERGHAEGSGAGGEPGVAEETRRHQRFSTYTTKCLDELRSADDVTAWTAGLDAALLPNSVSSLNPPSEARLSSSSPHLPPSNSSTSLGSFTHLEPHSLAHTPHSSTSTAATTASRSSCSPSVFSPSRWRRPRASDGARTSSSAAPPTPPRLRPPPRDSSPERTSSPAVSPTAAAARTPPRVVRFAASSPRSTSPSRPSRRHPPSPPTDPGWHVVATSRLRSDPNAQGQGHGALPPREPGSWARWTAPRPVVRAWERGDEASRAAARAGSRSSAGGRSRVRERSDGGELSWGERVGLELDRAARAAAAAVDGAEYSPG